MRLTLSFLFFLSLFYAPSGVVSSTSKFQTLLTKTPSSGLIRLDDGAFAELTDAPRDYFALVLLTALPAQFGCQLCREYQPEFQLLAQSWRPGDKNGDSRTLFGALDFPDGKATFQKVSLTSGAIRISHPNP